MVKPTDELPEDSAEKKEESNTENQQPFQSEPVVDFDDVDAEPENPSTEPKDPVLTAEGHDPAEIAAQINQNEGGGGLVLDQMDEDGLLQQVAGVFLLWWDWAYFEISIVTPNFPIYEPPKLVPPAAIKGSDELEFVYDIHDYGNKLVTSKGAEMYSAGMSMCRLFYTIEKMIAILVKRLQDEDVDGGTEVQVTFDGHLLAQRKAFESIINLAYNVVVTNFDPGAWGERYLEIVKRLVERNYGYPSEAPRDIYKVQKGGAAPTKK
ncbi:MAG: virulence factor [Gammaproteobacteria bacterium]|nr:virulence factor [Gammaproteobacteria bacterium]